MKMGEFTDISDFDKRKIATALRLGTSFSETEKLVGCSGAIVVTIYGKWLNDSETTSTRARSPRVINAFLLCKAS